MAILMDGKKLAEELFVDLKAEIKTLSGIPQLKAIQVGENAESSVYIKHKKAKCAEVGIGFSLLKLNKDISTEDLLEQIDLINDDDNVDGILVQLPLPKTIDTKLIMQSIAPWKDIDGFNPYNKGLLDLGEETLIPPTASGVMSLIEKYEIKLQGQHAVVLGAGEIAGKPVAKLFLNAGATVTICTKDTYDIVDFTSVADIIVSAVGMKDLFHGNDVKPGVVVINIGITKDINNEIHGDPEFESVAKKASYITPTPGGTGPLTVFHLLKNTVECYKNMRQL